MKTNDELIKILSKSIIDAAKKISKDSNFDKTSIGIIKEVNGNTYKVLVFGGTYDIDSSQTFNINQRVAVTAIQNNFNNLIIRAI